MGPPRPVFKAGALESDSDYLSVSDEESDHCEDVQIPKTHDTNAKEDINGPGMTCREVLQGIWDVSTSRFLLDAETQFWPA